jgi:hypothetical protein
MSKKGPGIVQKAAHLVKATAKHIMNDMKECTDEQLEERLGVCNGCEEWRDGDICTHPECGCALVRKAEWQSEDCPEGKWPKL